MARSQRGDQFPMSCRSLACRHDQATIGRAGKRGNTVLDLAGIARVDWVQLEPQRLRHGLDDTILGDAGAIRGVTKDANAPRAGSDLSQQLNPLPANREFELSKSGDVATWPRQTLDQTVPTGSTTSKNTMWTVPAERRNSCRGTMPLATSRSAGIATSSDADL
jgi:hypothetical protein